MSESKVFIWPRQMFTDFWPGQSRKKSWSYARAKTDKPRYQLRANSAALTRFQWWIVGMAIVVGAFGLLLGLAGRAWAGGGGLMGIAGLTVALAVVSANR